MWNDTDEPLAYFITFRTYGTWLHGDERGSVSRHKNVYGSARLPHESHWLVTNSSRMISEPVILNAEQRDLVKCSIKDTCKIREWKLWAAAIQTNHAHAVVSASSKARELYSML